MQTVKHDRGRAGAMGWRKAQACVDYVAYTHALPSTNDGGWQEISTRLRVLGICQDTAIGVTTVRNDWGFFQIPTRNFPELKVTFFRTARVADRNNVLAAIAAILEPAS
ncbi:MAG: hypothetical protein M0T84_16705 [Betaproteobacteria bacterium]|nr:hypothetical protein [Betaproteobacteria bacterium]